MCGLYSFRKSAEETRSLLHYLEELEFPPRDYVAPQSPIAIVREVEDRQLMELSDEMAAKLSIQYYLDARDALLKGLME